jgi:DNA anti-recombination protein RmuC
MAIAVARKPVVVTNAPAKPATPTPLPKIRGNRAPLFPLGPAIRLKTGQPTAGETQGGKRLFRTRDGQMVELPPDMTEEQAARLEVEAKAALQHLGKGPAPKPVPDVRKLAKKEVQREKPKPGAKGSRGGRVRAARKAARAITALLKAVSSTKVAQYLAAKGTHTLTKGVGMLQRLTQNEQTHDDAGEKLTQSEKAVVNPPSEGQAKSNTGQVSIVADRPAPIADGNKANQKFQESLEANTPKSIEDVDNFKRDMKAQHMGADVMQVVQGDKNAVTSTFGEIERTPAPFPPEHMPEALPPEEIAPPTPAMNLGQGAVAPLQPEHTDVSNFTKEADSKLKEEGVTQEQLDMVDSGDLAVAKKDKKGLESAARTEPLAVQAFARQQTEMIDRDLKQEEKKGRDGLRAKHKAELGATTRKQKSTQTALEKNREEVASKINGIYKAAQDSVKKKLDDLETQSMKRFDDGKTQAAKDFEDTVNRELDAYKDDRYSGWFGWARKAKDWWRGLDELPGVKRIFDRNRAIFVNTINQLVKDISADNKRVIQECKDELANARKAIKVFVDRLEPSLTDIGNKAAGEMNAKLNDLDQFINRKEEELQTKLKDKQTAAIKAIDEKIEKMKEAMAGALAKLGKLLLWAAKKFFTWALEKFGYSLEEIEGIINKGVAVLKAIFTKPVQFVKNLINAASLGFKNFAKNFLTHLKDAIFDWLTGSLEGVQLPNCWDIKGIASVALQMIGLTWTNIRGKLVKATNETTVKALETGFELVVTLVKDGPMAAWEKIVEMADDIKAAFIEGVKDFIKVKIIQKAIETILSLFIPGAGTIRAIVGIYDTVVFFIQKAKQIAQMVGNFLGSIGEIAAGNIGGAADALEKGLAMALKLVINFLAKFLRLDGITAKIRAAIGKLRDKVNSMLDRIVEWIVAKAKKLLGKLRGTKDKDKGKDKDKETSESKDVKAKIKSEVEGKQVNDKKSEHALLASLYAKYQPQGLKSIKLEWAGDALDVVVSASLAEKVASLTTKDLKILIRIAKNMNPYSKKTRIYVSYDDGKSYGAPIINSKEDGHAETRFKNKVLPRLLAKIQKDRRKLSTPAGQPVPIILDINRSPCDGCSKANLISIVESNAKAIEDETPGIPLIRLIVNVSSMTKENWQAIEQTSIGSLVAMRLKGIEINASTVWDAIEAKLREFEQFEYETKMYDRSELRQFKSEVIGVQKAVANAAKQIAEMPTDEKKE